MRIVKIFQICFFLLVLLGINILYANSKEVQTNSRANSRANSIVNSKTNIVTNNRQNNIPKIVLKETTANPVANVSNYQKIKDFDNVSVAKKAIKSTIELNSFSIRKLENKTEKIKSSATGFFINEEGLILTNYHNISGYETFQAVDYKDNKYDLKIFSYDEESDIALLKINEKDQNKIEKYDYIEFGDSDKIEIGEEIMLAGNPFSIGISVSKGIISAKNREINSKYIDLIQTDATINNGNSGGPMIDRNSQLIGIVTSIKSKNGKDSGVGFAIPSNYAKFIVDKLIKNGSFERGWIGLSVKDMNLADSENNKIYEKIANEKIKTGFFVTEVVNNGPAFIAGIKASDIIVKLNNQQINNTKELIKKIFQFENNERISITLIRAGKLKEIEVIVSTNSK